MEQSKTMTFTLFERDTEEARKWASEHLEFCPLRGKYLGAIGGGFSYTFTDTTIGQLTSMKCSCGAEKHLSNDV